MAGFFVCIYIFKNLIQKVVARIYLIRYDACVINN